MAPRGSCRWQRELDVHTAYLMLLSPVLDGIADKDRLEVTLRTKTAQSARRVPGGYAVEHDCAVIAKDPLRLSRLYAKFCAVSMHRS